jgi:hypothetical protein
VDRCGEGSKVGETEKHGRGPVLGEGSRRERKLGMRED